MKGLKEQGPLMHPSNLHLMKIKQMMEMMIKATNPMTLAMMIAVWHPTLRKARKSSTAHDWTAERDRIQH